MDGETSDGHSDWGEEVLLDLEGGGHGYEMFCGVLDGTIGR